MYTKFVSSSHERLLIALNVSKIVKKSKHFSITSVTHRARASVFTKTKKRNYFGYKIYLQKKIKFTKKKKEITSVTHRARASIFTKIKKRNYFGYKIYLQKKIKFTKKKKKRNYFGYT